MFPRTLKRIARTLVFLLFLGPPAYGQETGFLPGAHRGAVNALVEDGERIISAGEDGFLELWSVPDGAALERLQISVLPLKLMAKRPGKSQVCVWESDGFAENRVSVWDYREKKRIFALPSRDPVRFIGYSARGNFIFIVHSGRAGIVFINAETGENLLPPEIPGTPVFAATGRSERSLISCLADGSLSYWNLETGNEIQTLAAPSGLSSPVLFGGGRFLAGIDEGGLVILDAVTAKALTRDSRIKKGSFISAVPQGRELCCLVPGISGGGERQSFELFVWKGPDPSAPFEPAASGVPSGSGALISRGRFDEESISSFLAFDNGGNASYPAAVFGTGEGKAGLVYGNGGTGIFACKDQRRICEGAVSGQTFGFITDRGELGFLPSDFSRLESGFTLRLVSFQEEEPAYAGERNPYTRISALSGGEFILWQAENNRRAPAAVREGAAVRVFDRLGFRFPLQSVSALEDRALFLDAGGNTAVLDAKTGERTFSFSSAGAMDAAFADGENIILARSAVSGNSAFLKVNIINGETVALPWPASAGVRVYRGSSGIVYAAAVEGNPEKTVFLALDAANPSRLARLFEYEGEDALFAIAESGGAPALNPGGNGAAIYGKEGTAPFERGPGFPVKILDGISFFVVIDGDGNVSWQDNKTGKLLAVFSIQGDEWALRGESGTLRGNVSRGSGFAGPSQ
ncbi:MAG: WD40 repeat domain-containing protein [Treponema sp.]|jgi:hypothetical protein|nr:WD40 repeat domain-containing protein [Treponema sp.]